MNPIDNEPKPVDYSLFGGTAIDEEPAKMDYAQFGGQPIDEQAKTEKEKVGPAKSFLYGLAEGALGIPALAQYGINEYSKGLEKAFYGEEAPQLSFEEENPILDFMLQFPESEDQTSRRVRAGTAGVITGIPFGIPGIVAGLIGSQAGQTIREIFGKEGKFEEFGLGEASAIGADVLAGGASGLVTSLARQGGRAAVQQAPSIFRNTTTALERKVTQNILQGENAALQNVINDFGQAQIRGFEQQAQAISPNVYSDLTQSSASELQQRSSRMFRQGQLNIISPLEVTAEQGGRAIQESANANFQANVLAAEREAYNAANEAAANISGTLPRTIEEAKRLRADLMKGTPSSEQNQLIAYLNNFISELETTTAESTLPASSILDASGRPVTPATVIPATSEPTQRAANDLVSMVQQANQIVNYGSEFREQSHRLIPVVNTLRQEVGTILNQNPAARAAYQAANNLHAQNAEIWGTRYMRHVRFTENPETIVGQTQRASNMRNLKQAIPQEPIQGVAERLVIDKITEGGGAASNRNAVAKLAPELSPRANASANQLINVKDPLTTEGGRATVRNQILADAAQSVNTGKRPEKILSLMQTPKGYNIVRESMAGSRQSRELFQSFQRLFVEDIFNSIRTSTGEIDFSKARNIFKNQDVRNVVREIGGDSLVNRFAQLESYAANFERNLALYQKPETRTLFQKIVKEGKSAGIMGLVLHSMHVPIEILATLGLGKALIGSTKAAYKAAESKVLSNPRAVEILQAISKANTTEELAKQVPRFLKEIEKLDSE